NLTKATRPAPRFVRALVAGLLASLFIAVIGNLDGFVQIAEGMGKASGSDFQSNIIGVDGLVKMILGAPAVLFGGKPLPPFDYWRSSRVIPFTINEFPLWSFLFADLHPHMIGIPFTLLALGLSAHMLLPGTKLSPITGLTFALVLGAIATINTWDAPTYLGLALGALLLRRYWLQGLRGHWLPTLGGAALVGVASLVLYLPFFASYKALFVGLGVADQHTDVQPFLVVWGVFFFIAISFLIGEVGRRRRDPSPARFVQVAARQALRMPRLLELADQMVADSVVGLALVGLALLLGLSVLLVALGQPLIAILVWPFAFSALLLTRRNVEPQVAFANWLAFWAFAILLGVEVIYLQDFLGGGDWKRMNTLFKFYIQVWVLMSVLGALAVPALWSRLSARGGLRAYAWQGTLVVLVGAGLVFTLTGTWARVNDRFPSEAMRPPLGTLDGLAFMSVASYNWPDDRHAIQMHYDLEAIHWLQANVAGTPVVAEANVGYYRDCGLRVSSYTGLPTLLGMHQSEQRYAEDVGERDGQAREFFNTRDSARAMDLIRTLHIHYVYVGQL